MMWIVRGSLRGKPVEVHLEAPSHRKAVKAGSDRLIVVKSVVVKTNSAADRAKAMAAQDPDASRCGCGGYLRNSLEMNRGACADCTNPRRTYRAHGPWGITWPCAFP